MAPAGRDAPAIAALLHRHGLQTAICPGPHEASEQAEKAGTLLLTEEALELPGHPELLDTLREQPAWSELPLIVLTSGRSSQVAKLLDSAAQAAGSLFLLERPIQTTTLLRSVEVALRSRRRQYQVRELLESQQRKEEQLRASEQRYRTLFESIDAGFAVIEMIFDATNRPVDYRFLEINPAFAIQTGLADARGKTIRELVPDLDERWFNIYGRVALTGQPARFQDHAAAMGRWFDVYAFRVEPAGQRRVAILFTDITERRRAEETKARLAAIVEFSEDVIISQDLNSIITSWNRGAQRVFGYTPEEAIGQSIHLIIPPDRREEEDQILSRIRKKQPVEHYETVRRRKDGSLVTISLTISPIVDAAGNVVAVSKISRDITRQKEAEQFLVRRAAEQAALYEFTGALNRANSLGEIHEAALDALTRALHCNRASIQLLDDAGVMRFATSRGLSEEYRRTVEGHTPWPPDVIDPEPLGIQFDPANTDCDPAVREALVREQIRALVFIPITLGPKLIGKFVAYSDTPHEFTRDELNLGLTLARQLAFGMERKRAEEALRRSEDRARQQLLELEAIYQAAPLGLAVLDTHLRYRRINGRLAEMNGASVEAHLGRTVRDMAPALTEQAENALRQVLEMGTPLRFEFRGETPAQPGVERIWDEHWFPLADQSGPITGVGLVVEEVTERKRSEEDLRRVARAAAYRIALADALRPLQDPEEIQFQAACMLREFLDASRVQCAEMEPNGEFVVVKRDCARGVPSLTGRYRLTDFPTIVEECRAGRTFLATDLATDPRLTTQEKAAFAAMPVTGLMVIPILRHGRLAGAVAIHADKPRVWSPDEVAVAEETAERTLVAVERARAQHALRESEDRFRTLVAQVKDYAIFRMDLEGRPTSWNEGVQRVFQMDEPEFIGRDVIPVIFSNEDVQAGVPWEELRTAGETGTAGNNRWMRRKDGSLFFAAGATTALRNAAGELVGYTKVLRDETGMKQFQDELAEARARLQEHAENLERIVAERTHDLRTTNEQLETFVYSIAHDLRAPLRSMIGYSQLLSEEHAGSLDEGGKNLLKRIQASSEFMDKLLLDLLAYGRAARAEIELRPVELQRAWDAALFQCSAQMQQSHAHVEAAGPLPTVVAHEATLGQSLANLLSNALKFVEPGVAPRVRLWTEERDGWIRIWIADNGIGIPASQHERIFRVFERSHGARYVGTGIGLSIVRKGIERMGGKVGLESEPGHGSRFWIELPKAA